MGLLQKGDVIELKTGDKIYATIDGRFLGSGFSDQYETDITIGRPLNQLEAMKPGDDGYDPGYFERETKKQFEPGYTGVRGLVGAAVGVTHKVVATFNTNVFAGTYIVLYTTESGGGSQGTPSGVETYPNGHRVYCKQIVDNKICGHEVSFYQSGCFSAMIQIIEPVGKAELGYTFSMLR